MNNINKFKREPRKAWSLYILQSIVLSALFLTGFQTNLQAQEAEYTVPSWRFGLAAGANLNLYGGTTQELNLGFFAPKAFSEGKGAGLYLAPLWEYHPATKLFGFMFQAGYDNRNGAFDQVIEPCNCPADLSANLSYITFEPSLRLAPFKSGFYLYAGPRFALNFERTFLYSRGVNPDFPNEVPIDDINEEFSEMRGSVISMQVGAGYDIKLSKEGKQNQTYLSPFVSFQPFIGQNPRSIESWNLTTLRVGAALKFGRGIKIVPDVVAPLPVAVVFPDPAVNFTVTSPKNIPAERRVRETFPISNFVFFNEGSTAIPDRYVKLQKSQVANFDENQLDAFRPIRLSGRSDRQMTVYYNVLNILGNRMVKNPGANVSLSGSSDDGIPNGLAMAESVKKYLVDVFEINPSRITTEGRINPKVPSEQPGGTNELVLLREEDRRVSISSDTPGIMMEFKSGQSTPLRPIEFDAVQSAPFDSYVTFNADGADEAFDSWNLELKDEKGVVQKYGPFNRETVYLSGKSILGTRTKGDFQVAMVGKTESGKNIRKETYKTITLWTPDEEEIGIRHSLLFEFDESNTIAVYEDYLTNVVVPKIPENAKVIIHGHSDIIGSDVNNEQLSLARATEVRELMDTALLKAGRNDVKFETYGFGEDEDMAPFDNVTPEERFYNRTVIIDIIPQK